jgi:CheY-like chemotaxis protein
MPDQNRPNILVVDDLPANLHSMKKLLEKLDVNIVLADSGNRALTLLLKDNFRLILLDVNMPIMDGYETAELILQLDELEHMPIIFVTAHDKDHQHTFRENTGRIDYIFKPIDADILINKVKSHLELLI